MKGITAKILTIALLLGVASCASSDRTVKVEQGVVKAIRVKGMARYSLDRHAWLPLEKGMQLKAGVVMQTAPKSLVDLCLNDGHPQFPHDGSERTSDHLIRIFENSALQINQLTREESGKRFSQYIEFELRAGQIMGAVGILSPESKYNIRLPKGNVAVYGGTYMVSSSGVVNVLKGTAVTTKFNADGSEVPVEIHSHESFDPATGAVTRLAEEQVRLTVYNPDTLICGPRPIPTGYPVSGWPASTDPLYPASGPPANSGLPHGSGMGGSLRKF
jgi:hypothetical protein